MNEVKGEIGLYIVTIQEEFVRDIQVCSIPEQIDLLDESGWDDFEGEVVAGFSTKDNIDDAIGDVAERIGASGEVLTAYKLSNDESVY